MEDKGRGYLERDCEDGDLVEGLCRKDESEMKKRESILKWNYFGGDIRKNLA